MVDGHIDDLLLGGPDEAHSLPVTVRRPVTVQTPRCSLLRSLDFAPPERQSAHSPSGRLLLEPGGRGLRGEGPELFGRGLLDVDQLLSEVLDGVVHADPGDVSDFADLLCGGSAEPHQRQDRPGGVRPEPDGSELFNDHRAELAGVSRHAGLGVRKTTRTGGFGAHRQNGWDPVCKCAQLITRAASV